MKNTTKASIAACFTKHWVCQVVRSGFHNGASCTPDDPHGGWSCGYRFESSMTEGQFDRFLAILDDDEL